MEDYYYADFEYEDDDDPPEYAEYYEYENYDSLLESTIQDMEEEVEPIRRISFGELYEYCMMPTLKDSYSHLVGIMLWPLLFLLASKLVRLPHAVVHFLSFVFGCYYTWLMFDWRTRLLVGLFVISCCGILCGHFLLKKHRGILSFLVGVMYLVVCELWWVEAPIWHTIRGIQMIILMKVVSIGFDVDSQKIKSLPTVLETLGYIFHPGTILFGPWISFPSYKEILLPTKWRIKWVLRLLLRLMASAIFLLISTCGLNWLIPEGSHRFLQAYRDALSFRTSHYFVSSLSEVLSSLAGIDVGSVSRPYHIEFPRSLVEVVIYWNIPMHYWLKTYVFKSARANLGMLPALLSTYFVSALFHGLNFQLGSVLLSLGFYTYTEYVLRKKLAESFSACIGARRCGPNCEHNFKESSLLCRLLNLFFGVIATFHLAYLGMMFDSSPRLQESGYSMLHTFKKWGQFGYASHWLAFISYVIMSVL